MRFLMTSFAIVLALFACGPSVMYGAQGGDTGTNAAANAGTAGVAGAPTIPPAPTPASTPMSVPTASPAPVPTFAPSPAPGRVPAGQARDEFGNPNVIQTPIADPNTGVAPSANATGAANPSGDQWRYRLHNGTWWYWTPENRWIYRNGNDWVNYEPTPAVAPGPSSASQPAYGYYGPNFYGNYSTPYGYSTGYRGYYNYSPGYQGGYYGPGTYYGQPGILFRARRGGGFRIGF